MKVLVTGFEPFGGEPTNPSWEVASRLPARIGGHEIVAVRLPVEFERAVRELAETLVELEPDAVVSLGQAAGRGAITPELVAVNAARGADAAGAAFAGEKLAGIGESWYFTNLSIEKGIAAANAAGSPTAMSRDAGGYICNAVMYAASCVANGADGAVADGCALSASTQQLLKSVAEREFAGKLRCGFVHLPLSVEQSARRGRGEPSMELERMVRGVEAYLPATLE